MVTRVVEMLRSPGFKCVFAALNVGGMVWAHAVRSPFWFAAMAVGTLMAVGDVYMSIVLERKRRG